jgi:peptide/nickel transport system permease protein
MARAILSRVIQSIATLFGVCFILFLLTRSMGDTPASIVLGIDASPQAIAQFEAANGLDRPILVQYGSWVGSILLHGDFGRSFVTNRQAATEIERGLPVTLELISFAFAFALIVALPLGALAALYSGTLVDQAARVVGVVGLSIPGFWLALLLIRLVSLRLQLLPPGGLPPLFDDVWNNLRSAVLPSFALGVFQIAIISRMMRSSLMDVVSADYVRTAVAMGLRRHQILLYTLRNALGAVVSVAALCFGYTFGWALIIEQVFSIPGVSRALLTAISQRDYVLVQAIVFVFTLIFILCNLTADLLNLWLNPRLRMTAV